MARKLGWAALHISCALVVATCALLHAAASAEEAERTKANQVETWYRDAVARVDKKVGYAQTQLEFVTGRPLAEGDREVLTALIAAREVSNQLSVLLYGAGADDDEPILDTDDAILHGAGICGHHAEAAIRLMRRLGLPARSAQFYRAGPKGDESHVIVEAFAGGAWRMIDVTWRAWFLKDPDDPFSLASLNDLTLRGRKALTLRIDGTSPSSLVAGAGGDVMAYLDPWPDKVTLSGVAGAVSLKSTPDGWAPTKAPDFIGRTLDHGRLAEGALAAIVPLKKGPRIHGLRLKRASAFCRNGAIEVRDRRGRLMGRASLAGEGGRDLEIAIAGDEPRELRIEVAGSPEETCYVTYEAVVPLVTESSGTALD